MSDTVTDLTSRQSFARWTAVSIRYSDQDPMGHVNNVALASYIEAARTMLIQTILDRFDHPNLDFVLARVAIDYRNEFHYPGTADVGARLLRLGTKSITSGYGVFVGDLCVASAESVNVLFDMDRREGVAPPDDVRAALEAELAAAP